MRRKREKMNESRIKNIHEDILNLDHSCSNQAHASQRGRVIYFFSLIQLAMPGQSSQVKGHRSENFTYPLQYKYFATWCAKKCNYSTFKLFQMGAEGNQRWQQVHNAMLSPRQHTPVPMVISMSSGRQHAAWRGYSQWFHAHMRVYTSVPCPMSPCIGADLSSTCFLGGG